MSALGLFLLIWNHALSTVIITSQSPNKDKGEIYRSVVFIFPQPRPLLLYNETVDVVSVIMNSHSRESRLTRKCLPMSKCG